MHFRATDEEVTNRAIAALQRKHPELSEETIRSIAQIFMYLVKTAN